MPEHVRVRAGGSGAGGARVPSGPQVTGTLSDSDSLLWSLGADPVLAPVVVAVVVFDRVPRWAELRRRVGRLAEAVPAMRSAVSARPFGVWRPRWVLDPGFDLDRHLRRSKAREGRSLRAVLDIAQSMASESFDSRHPLWEALLVERVVGVERVERGEGEGGEGFEGGGRAAAALVVKLHHSLIDGVGGMSLLLELFDRGGGPERALGSVHSDADVQAPSAPRGVSVHALVGAGASVARVTLGLVRTGASVLRNPERSLGGGIRMASSVVSLLAPGGKPLSGVMVGRSGERRFEVIDLERGALRAAASATSSTVNDVFLASILLGLRRYHELHGCAVEALRVLMPVSVRNDRDPVVSNRFVPVRFVLPVVADPALCLCVVHAICEHNKSSPALALNDVLAGALDILPARLATAIWGSMLEGDDFCATNVAGPPFETYLAGARVERLYAFAPPSGAALNVSLLNPAGRECIGINLDAAAVADPAKLTACLGEGFDQMISSALGTSHLVSWEPSVSGGGTSGPGASS